MAADAAVERHDGTPPGEDQIAARMRAEGLSPHGWGNGPGDTYGWHEHDYELSGSTTTVATVSNNVVYE